MGVLQPYALTLSTHSDCRRFSLVPFISVGLDYGSGSPDSKLGKTVLAAVGITQSFRKAYCIAESYFTGK
jgi:hypothetical protein